MPERLVLAFQLSRLIQLWATALMYLTLLASTLPEQTLRPLSFTYYANLKHLPNHKRRHKAKLHIHTAN